MERKTDLNDKSLEGKREWRADRGRPAQGMRGKWKLSYLFFYHLVKPSSLSCIPLQNVKLSVTVSAKKRVILSCSCVQTNNKH